MAMSYVLSNLGVSHVGVDEAHAAEFPAVFVAVDGVGADGVSGLVHEGTVSGGHHVSAQGWVDGGAVLLIRNISTVVVPVTPPCGVDTPAVGTLPLSGGVTHTVQLVTGVVTVVVSVTLPAGVDTFGAIGAFELVGGAGTGAVPLVPVVPAVVVSVTDPGGLDTQEVVTLDLTGGALDLVAVDLVSQIAAVVITVTLELLGDTLAVLTQELVGAGAVGGASNFVRFVSTVSLSVTHPVSLDTASVFTGELIGFTGGGGLSLGVCPGFWVHIFLGVLLANFGFSTDGDCHQQNETHFEHHDCRTSD